MADDARDRLAKARLLLVFTPAAVPAGRDALAALAAALPAVDLVQVRVKPLGDPRAVSSARETAAWTRRVLAVVAREQPGLPVTVNDRVDVALALADEGCAGVHLGQDDLPPAEARALLGASALIGLSTHGARDVAEAATLPVDYLGFGPVWSTATKGYARGLGPEAAWIASEGAGVPVFPIGGVDAARAGELAPVGRAAVGAAILAAEDPAEAAALIAAELAG